MKPRVRVKTNKSKPSSHDTGGGFLFVSDEQSILLVVIRSTRKTNVRVELATDKSAGNATTVPGDPISS